MKIPDTVYDALKWTAIIGLPALGVAYSSLAGIWSLPLATEIPATLDVISLFLGTILGVTSVRYAQAQKRDAP